MIQKSVFLVSGKPLARRVVQKKPYGDTVDKKLHSFAMALMLCDHLWATAVPGKHKSGVSAFSISELKISCHKFSQKAVLHIGQLRTVSVWV